MNPNTTGLIAGLNDKGPEIFKSLVNEWVISEDGILVLTNVIKPTPMTKLSSTGSPRPYRANDDSNGNTAQFSDRTLTAYQTKWDFEPFTEENFRNTHLASKKAMLYVTVTEKLAEDYLNAVHDNALYLGVYNANGTTAAALGTGWGTIIANEITAGNLTNVVVTGAITTANALAAVESVIQAAPAKMKAPTKNGIVYMSFNVFDKYKANYRAANNNNNFSPKAGTNDYFIDGYPNIKIRPVAWMGNSQRIIFTLWQNFVFGTEGDAVTLHPSPKYDTIELRMKMPVGMEIQDLECLWVNEQA